MSNVINLNAYRVTKHFEKAEREAGEDICPDFSTAFESCKVIDKTERCVKQRHLRLVKKYE